MSSPTHFRNVRILNDEAENSVTETFEVISRKSFIMCSVLFASSVVLIILGLSMLPPYEVYENAQPSFGSNSNRFGISTNIGSLSIFFRSAEFGCKSTSLFKHSIIAIVSGTFTESLNGAKYRSYMISDTSVQIPHGKYLVLFRQSSPSASSISGAVDFALADGSYDDLSFSWRFRSRLFVFFATILKFSCFFLLLYLYQSFSRRLQRLNRKKPTKMQLFLSSATAIGTVASFPLQELNLLGIFAFSSVNITNLIDFFDVLHKPFFLWVFSGASWGLVHRFEPEEAKIYKNITKFFLFISIIYAFPLTFIFSNARAQSYFSSTQPCLITGALIVNLIRCPLRIETQMPEFTAALIQLMISGIGGAAILFEDLGEKSPKTSIASFIINTIGLMFIVLLHWPHEENGDDAQYVKTEEPDSRSSDE